MDNDEIIKEETEYIKDIKDIKDIDNIKLNYDYHSYENIINTNQQLKQLIPSKSKKEYNITLNSNILLNNKQNELKRNSLTEISNIKNKDINIINNNNNENKKYIQTTRNNNNKISYNLLNLNKINNDYKNIITQKESLEKKLYLNDLMNEESKDYETLELITKKSNNKKNNKKTDNYIITNDNIDIDVEEEEESIEYSNNENKVLKNYKSNPQLNTVRDNYSNVNKCANFIMQNKYDELYKEYFNTKTKYEISKTNMNILQKKLKQKNEYISQLKKILISNKHQISFLISLKDSNAKSLKDNETLINNLKLTIANLNTKIIELKNKLSQKIQSNLTNDEIKVENDTLKIYLNDRDKTISTLKNSLSFLTQNLDSILHITENDKKLNEYNIEKLEKYLINMKELNENINKKNKEIIDIKNDNEQLKKNIEDKNIQIKDLNIIIEQKNKEINDMQKLILEKNNNNFSKELKVIKQSSFALYHKIKNNENKIVIKKIKKNQSESKNKNHFNKEKLFKNNKFRIKTNFDYFNDNDDFIENEPKKTMKSLYNINYRKNKSNKNFNTIIGNNFFINRTTTTNLNNIESKIDTERTLKLHLYNTNDDDLKKNYSIKPYNKNNKIKKQKSNLILSTSTISLSQNENIKSITYPEKSASNFDFIYSLVNNSDLICFNLKQKKFDIRKINDNTKGIYTSYISYYRQNKLQPLLLNTQKYFYILMQKYIFYYDSSLNCINILTKAFSNHLNGKFIQIENSLYLISGNKNTQCELY